MVKQRYFKININLIFFSIQKNSKVHPIHNNFVLVGLSIWYSLIALLLGIWSFSRILDTIQAIDINSRGGEDFTEEVESMKYDDKTNYIWNNLTRETTSIITLKEIAFIIEIQENFEQSNSELFTEFNLDYIHSITRKIPLKSVSKTEIRDILNAFELYSKRMK